MPLSAPITYVPKVALNVANVANNIALHLNQKLPSIVSWAEDHNGTWFTGSQVWSWLYGLAIPVTSDTDIFFLGDRKNTGEEMMNEFIKDNLSQYTWHSKSPKVRGNYRLGLCYNTSFGNIDIWFSEDTVQSVLNDYPDDSHAHCRAAYSFTQGLIVLPNIKGW